MAERQAHVVGVGGIGMSAVAQVLVAQGWNVSGSDRGFRPGASDVLWARLQGAGVRLVPQDGSAVTGRTDRVIVSTAIEDDNADMAAARAAGVPVVHRAEALAEFASRGRCLAVTGTSGKTTVTGMLGWALAGLGLDPTVVNGGVVTAWANDRAVGNVRMGQSDLWVLEADESDRSLMRFRPDWAIVTNVSGDHFSARDAEELFGRFRAQVRCGTVGPIGSVLEAGGFSPALSRVGSRFAWRGCEVRVPLPGRHNAENALLALELCVRMGLDARAAAAALATFPGIERRLQPVGTARGVTVIDDYAHNPAKIEASWNALAPYSPRILGVWRPHGFAPLAAMMDELAGLFPRLCRPQDRLFLLPVYYAGGTASRTVSSDDLAQRLAGAGLAAEVCASPEAAEERLLAACSPGDVVLVMGARDPGLPALCRRLLARLAS